jgi:hypothetical protein
VRRSIQIPWSCPLRSIGIRLTGITCLFTADAAPPNEEMIPAVSFGYSESAKSEGALISRTGHRAVLWIFLILTCAVLALVGSALYTTDQNQPDRPGT